MTKFLMSVLLIVTVVYMFGSLFLGIVNSEGEAWFVEGVVTSVVDEYRCYPDEAYAGGEVCGMVTTVYLREAGKLLARPYVVKNHWDDPIDMAQPQCRFKVIRTPYGDNGIIALGCTAIGGTLPANWLQR